MGWVMGWGGEGGGGGGGGGVTHDSLHDHVASGCELLGVCFILAITILCGGHFEKRNAH